MHKAKIMKLLTIETKTDSRQWRVCDYYTLDLNPLPDFCQGKDPWEVVRVEIYGHNVTATFQKHPSEPMPETVTLPDGKELRCIQSDKDGVVTATGYFPANAKGETQPHE